MRVLLLNPYLIQGHLFFGFMKKIGSNLPPLGLAYLASYLEELGHSVKIIDNKIEKYDLKTLLKVIDKFNPDIIGISSITTHLLYTTITARFLKRNLKNIIIVVGGPHASAAPEELLNFCKEIDYIIVGEGELGFKGLLENIKNPEKLSSIPGIVFKNKMGNIVRNKSAIIEDINMLPFPARHFLPMSKYKPSIINYNKLPSRSLITSRGCSFNCSYCYRLYKGKVRANKPEKIFDEISLLINEYNAKELIYWDDCFTFNKTRLINLFKILKENQLDLPWMSMARVDQMSKKFLIDLKKNNCWRLGFGIESGDPYVLKKMNKDINLQKANETIKFCKKIGIQTRIFLMIGTPYDNFKSVTQTINIAKKLNPDIVQYSFYTPFPQTRDYEYILQNIPSFDSKYYFKEVYPDYHNLDKLIFVPNGFTEKKVKKLHAQAYLKFYFRSNYIFNQIKKIKTISELYKNLSISINLINDISKKIF